MSGVTKPSISSLTKEGGKLSPAMIGKKIYVDHPLVKEWLAEKAATSDKPLVKPSEEIPIEESSALTSSDESGLTLEQAKQLLKQQDLKVDNLDSMTLREIVEKFGTIQGFKTYVEALRLIADTKQRELKLKVDDGDVISTDFVVSYLYPLFDLSYTHLVSSIPEQISLNVIDMVNAGADHIEIKEYIKGENSKSIIKIKEEMDKLEFFK